MIPADVLLRCDLTAYDKVVLATMSMESYGSGGVIVSHSVLAKKCGVSRTQVLASQSRLVSAGLIEKDGPPLKQVQSCRLLHPRLNADVRIAPKSHAKCSSCSKPRNLAVSGKCRPCIAESEKLRRYEVARKELGESATESEIAKHLDAETSQRRWRKIASKAQRAA